MPSVARALALLLTLALACSGTAGTPTGTLAPGRLLRPRPPVNVSYNHRGLLIDGAPTLWIAGSMHYARFTPGLWPNALRLAKEVGMNGVTSYVMWNLHEPRRGSYDFSGRRNVSAFLQAAHDAGLMVHLRFGPYIDGEWDYGGFPWWVNSPEANMSCLRCSDPAFKAAMTAWMRTFVEHVRPFLATNGGPVVMIQVENEKSCDGTAPMQGTGDREYTEWAIETALGLDTGVPWSFCNNSNSCNLPDTPGVIFTANGQGVAGSWFSGGMYDHYDSQPALWSEVEEGFATWDADLWKSQQPNELARHVAHFYAQ